MKKSRSGIQRSEESLRALDYGRYAEALERLNAGEVPGRGDESTLWRAEVLLYLDRLEEAAEALGGLGEGGEEPGTVAECRARLVRAEIAYFENRLDEAEEHARAVLSADAAREEPSLFGRAWYDLGRIARKRSEFMIALEHLLVARQYAKLAENDFLEGVIAYNRAYSWYELSDFAATDSCYVEALERLSRSENLRYRAIVQNAYAGYLSDLDRHDEALALASDAERTSADLGIVSDMLWAGNNTARTLIRLGRYREARERMMGLLEWERATRHSSAEIVLLQQLAIAECALGLYEESVRSAGAAAHLATLSGNPSNVLDAELLGARARSLAGHPSAPAELRALRDRADQGGFEHQRVEARIYLAESLVTTAPVEAAALCEETREFPLVAANSRFRSELERVERLVTTAPIRVEPEGIFQVDVRTQWPSLKSAREALERFLITKAVESTGGNLAAAGRLIGETRFQMHYLWKMMHDAPPRPALSESAAAKSRKRRPRNLFADRRK
jgi:tetratricopeptide (TPR) repeat protein